MVVHRAGLHDAGHGRRREPAPSAWRCAGEAAAHHPPAAIAAEEGSDPASLIAIAQRAESAGFSAVSLSDHVVMGAHADRYPWGDFAFPPEAPWNEPLSVLTAIAASTHRLGLTTSILIVPLRPAALLAKWAATIDVVSGGRLELGVGTGWQKEEFRLGNLDRLRVDDFLAEILRAAFPLPVLGVVHARLVERVPLSTGRRCPRAHARRRASWSSVPIRRGPPPLRPDSWRG